MARFFFPQSEDNVEQVIAGCGVVRKSGTLSFKTKKV